MTILRETKGSVIEGVRLVRFENRLGEGLFQACHDFLDEIDARLIRSRTKKIREIESLYTWLRNHTGSAPRDAYADRVSRFPYTWFRSTAKEHVRKAQRLVDLLNGEGMDIRRIETELPIKPLYEDANQVVIRRPRGPRPEGPNPFLARRKARVKKQVRRRLRAGRIKARSLKSGIE